MHVRHFLFISLAMLVMAGCAAELPVDVAKKLDESHEALVRKDTDYFRENLIPSIMEKETFEQTAKKIWALIPEGEYVARKLISRQSSTETTASGEVIEYYEYKYQYEFESGFAAVIFGVQRQGETLHIHWLNVTPMTLDVVALHEFTFENKPVRNLVFLGLMLCAAGLSVAALVRVVILRKQLRRPIRWGIFVAIGVYLITLNWTDGEVTPQSLFTASGGGYEFSFPHIGLFSAGAERSSLAAPWILNLYIPLGALLFWLQAMRGRLAMRPVEGKPEEHPEPAETGGNESPPRM